MEWQKPLRHMRDYLSIVNSLLADGSSDHHGTYFSLTQQGPRPTDTAPSVMLAALGPQMLALAGSQTDGTILWMVGARTIAEHIAPTIEASAMAANRSAPRIVCSLPIAVTDDVDATRALHGQVFVRYGELPSYRAMLDREGASGPADVCIIGDETAVNVRLDELAEAGTTDFSALILGLNPDDDARTRTLLRSRP